MTLPGPIATPDLILVAVALPLVAGALASLLWSIQLGLALAAGSLPAGGTIGYAIFYDPPE